MLSLSYYLPSVQFEPKSTFNRGRNVVNFYNVIGVFCNNITIICIQWATLYTIAQSFSSWCQQTAELFRLQNLTHGHCRHTCRHTAISYKLFLRQRERGEENTSHLTATIECRDFLKKIFFCDANQN